MKAKKHVLPFVFIFALSLFASKPFIDRNGGALNLSFSSQAENPMLQPDDEEGWSIIRYKIFFPPQPEKPTADLAKRDELLAYYGE